MINPLLPVALAVSLVACMAYQPPSGRGYDYDRGRALARSDIGADRFVYLVTGYDGERLASLRERIEARCGFTIRLAHPATEADPRRIEFAQGYNSVSVPAIEQRLGARMQQLIQRCAEQGAD